MDTFCGLVARTVLDLKLGDHITSALRELHWLPITERIQYKLCLLVHKMFVGHAPDYIASLLTPASDIPARSSLHSSSNCDLPRTSRKIGDRAFSAAALRALNRLPTDFRAFSAATLRALNRLPTDFRAFSAATPRALNRLPTDLKLLRSTASFKSKLTSFLLHAAYTGNTV